MALEDDILGMVFSLWLKKFIFKTLFYLGAGTKKCLFLFLFLFRQPLKIFGRFIFKILVVFYKHYLALKFKLRRNLGEDSTALPQKINWSKKIFSLNHYITHIAIVIIAFATALEGLTASRDVLSNYGQNSLLFSLFSEEEEEFVVEGVLSDADFKNESYLGQQNLVPAEKSENSSGEQVAKESRRTARDAAFVGADLSPVMSGKRTRLTIEEYTIQQGDTLGKIAQKFDISLNTLLWSNNLTSYSRLKVGNKLVILPVSGLLHKVRSGENLAGIAKKYKVNLEEVVEFNELSPGARLALGQTLIIPHGKMPPPSPHIRYYSAPAPNTILIPTTLPFGAMVWPAQSRRITQYFSWRHRGIDIGAPKGTPIYAVASGIVESAGWGGAYGYRTTIRHSNGIKTLYAHASRLFYKSGETVDKGDVVALVGSTGRSTGPHLHFEIWINGVKRNPFEFVR